MNDLHTTLFKCSEDIESFNARGDVVKNEFMDMLGRAEFKDAPLLNLKFYENVKTERYTRIRISYGNESDDIVWAWLLVPYEISDAASAVICLPGSYMTPNWGKDAVVGLAGPEVVGTAEHYGAILVENGFVALCPDYSCAGQRVKTGLKPYDTSDIESRFPHWTRVGMSLWDIGRAIEVLQNVDYVDDSRIGCMGLSQGGEMSVMAGAFYGEISAIVSVCGWSPWAGRNIQGLCESFNYPGLAEYCKKGSRLGWDYDYIAALVAPKPFLNITGINDPYFPDKEQLYNAEEEIKRLYYMYGKGDYFQILHLDHAHECSWQAMDAALNWFEKWFEVRK